MVVVWKGEEWCVYLYCNCGLTCVLGGINFVDFDVAFADRLHVVLIFLLAVRQRCRYSCASAFLLAAKADLENASMIETWI